MKIDEDDFRQFDNALNTLIRAAALSYPSPEAEYEKLGKAFLQTLDLAILVLRNRVRRLKPTPRAISAKHVDLASPLGIVCVAHNETWLIHEIFDWIDMIFIQEKLKKGKNIERFVEILHEIRVRFIPLLKKFHDRLKVVDRLYEDETSFRLSLQRLSKVALAIYPNRIEECNAVINPFLSTLTWAFRVMEGHGQIIRPEGESVSRNEVLNSALAMGLIADRALWDDILKAEYDIVEGTAVDRLEAAIDAISRRFLMAFRDLQNQMRTSSD